jgi:heptosyltransferase II
MAAVAAAGRSERRGGNLAMAIRGGLEAGRILIRSTNWIGDVVMSLAAVRELRRLHPQATLSVFAREWVAGLFEGQGLVDEIIAFPCGRHTLGWSRRLKGFDAAVIFQNAFEAALLTFLARIPERIGYATQHRGPLLTRRAGPRSARLRRHQVYHYLDLLYLTGVSPRDYLNDSTFRPDVSLRPTPDGVARAGTLLAEMGVDGGEVLVGLNPGAFYGPAKRWFSERYASLADRLIGEQRARVLIFGSKGEERIADEILGRMRETPLILTGRTDLALLVALIARCRLFITNDSGPMHLAAALAVPQIALFGSTDEVATGPFSDRATVIHKHAECSPCLRRECPIDLRCFSRITVDEVYEAARERLRS